LAPGFCYYKLFWLLIKDKENTYLDPSPSRRDEGGLRDAA